MFTQNPIIIKSNECAYVMKDGIFTEILIAGRYGYPYTSKRYKVIITTMQGAILNPPIPVKLLLENPIFQKKTTYLQLADNEIAIHYVNGAFRNFEIASEVLYWNIFEQHTFTIIDVSDEKSWEKIPRNLRQYVPSSLSLKVEVKEEGEVALLYQENQLVEELSQGIYWYWLYNNKYTYTTYDTRIQMDAVTGQEILTADKVSVRMNFTYSYKITDVTAVSKTFSNFQNQLYNLVQMSVRDYVGRLRLDEILAQKTELGEKILEKLIEKEDEFYVHFSEAGIKDIILPGDVQSIMNTVLLAEKKAQANVITRREEVASTRSLLNTAKLMDENKTLYKLKEMEYIEKISQQVGDITVSGGDGLMKALTKILTGRNED